MADPVNKLRSVIRAALGMPTDPGSPPDLMMLGLYRATVNSAASDGSTLDVTPEDTRIPPAKNVPMRVGIPGAVVVVQAGSVVLIGWERGDPARAYCVPSWESGASVTKLVFPATTVYLGAESGSNFVALANLVKARLDTIQAAHDSHEHTAPSGGGPTTGNTSIIGTLADVAAVNTKAK
jgi:hypothetical protein